MKNRAQRQAVVPRTAEVRYIDISIAYCLILTPLEQSVALGPAVLHQTAQRILAFRQICHAVPSHEVNRLGVQSARV